MNTETFYEGEPVVCLGRQLASIVASVSEKSDDLIWFASDVTSNDYSEPISLRDQMPTLVGDSSDMVSFSERYDQFLSGCFIAFKKGSVVEFSSFMLSTEETSGDMGGAMAVIKAVDTTVFELVTPGNTTEVGFNSPGR